MKERPILFSAPMVRAILDGSKTQTRRACKPMNAWTNQECRYVRMVDGEPFHFLKDAALPIEKLRCPYGQPGDRLWVRETFSVGGLAPDEAYYRATAIEDGLTSSEVGNIKWKPSIFMPRWASRITLEITAVRVERLQDISEADAVAEGVVRDSDGYRDYEMPSTQCRMSAKASYRTLWASINGPDAWDKNPWVWCVSFKRVPQ